MTLSITRTDTVLDAENSSEQNIAPVTKISPYNPRRDKQKINRKHTRKVYQINDRGRAIQCMEVCLQKPEKLSLRRLGDM